MAMGDEVVSLESALIAFEEKITEAQKAVDALSKTIRGLRKATQVGQITEIPKRLSAIEENLREAEAASRSLAGAWSFDATNYLERSYFDELSAAASDAGVKLFEKEGRVYAFPLLLRILPREMAVRIGKKLERRIRPKVLVSQLAAMQKREQRFSEQRFLDLLYRAYQFLAGQEWRRITSGSGPVIPLADIHGAFTLLPDSDYSIEEFGRDLLMLDRKPELRTREGFRITFPGAALAREKVQRIAVYDEDGRERLYLGLSFIKEP
jgi:hypothetical protein